MSEIVNGWPFGIWLTGVLIFGTLTSVFLLIEKDNFRRSKNIWSARSFRNMYRLWRLVPIWPLGLLWLAFRWIPGFVRGTKRLLADAKEMSS